MCRNVSVSLTSISWGFTPQRSHSTCWIDRSLKQLLWPTYGDHQSWALVLWFTNMPHTPIMLGSSLPWAGEQKLLLCECLGLLLFPAHSLSCSLPVNFAQKASPPSLLDSFCYCQHPIFHGCATLQNVLQLVLGAFPHAAYHVFILRWAGLIIKSFGVYIRKTNWWILTNAKKKAILSHSVWWCIYHSTLFFSVCLYHMCKLL